MNVLDTIRRTVMAYPGSYNGMAAAIGMSPNILRNKTSRTNDTHHLYVIELTEIVQHAADANVPDAFAALRYLAAEFGFQLVREGEGAGASDLSIAEKLIQTNQRQYELGLAVIHGIADGEITPEEMDAITEARRLSGQASVELEEMARGFVAHSSVTSLRRDAA